MNGDIVPPVITAEESPPARPDHRVFFHWLPWLLPIGAILLPLAFLAIIGTARDPGGVSMNLAARASDRGDFLIPVAIICAEGCRRWWDTSFSRWITAAFCGTCAWASAFLALIAIAVFMLVASNPPTRGYADIANAFTWGPLMFGLIAGTITVRQTQPGRKAGGS